MLLYKMFDTWMGNFVINTNKRLARKKSLLTTDAVRRQKVSKNCLYWYRDFKAFYLKMSWQIIAECVAPTTY